jgi:hypothetical protein
MAAPSAYFGNDAPWHSKTNVHNPMLDQDGRLWLTARVRDRDTPAFCREVSEHPSARRFPVTASGRQLGMYDPRTQVYQTIDTCFGTHHLMFAMDDNNTLWTSAADLKNLRYYFRTFDNSRIRMVDMKAVDLDAKEIRTISMRGEEEIEDVSGKAN